MEKTRKKVAVVARRENDILTILERTPGLEVTRLHPDSLGCCDLEPYDSFVLLGGTEEEACVLNCADRLAIEREIGRGKRVFAEFYGSIGPNQYFLDKRSTRYSRMVYVGDEGMIEGLEYGDILEEQCNVYTPKHVPSPRRSPILVTKEHICAHGHVELSPEEVQEERIQTLWQEDENLMICNFRMCNFIRSVFAPKKSWRSLVEHILSWAVQAPVDSSCLPDHYTQGHYREGESFEAQARRTVERAMGWFDEAGILLDEGRRGMLEGFGTEVYPDGSRRRTYPIRDDCMGEAAMMYAMDYMANGTGRSLRIADNLFSYCFDYMQRKEEGIFRGMIGWTDAAWGVCYTHDTARLLVGELLKNMYLGTDTHMREIGEGLDYLIRTSGSDGLRARRLDNVSLDEERVRRIQSAPCDDPEPGDAYFFAALLMYYKLTGTERYREAGIRGFESFLEIYPSYKGNIYTTGRLTGTVMGLAWLYYTTGDPRHKKALYDTVEELKTVRHPNGGYMEWVFNGEVPKPNIGDEGSMLVENGNPIVDNLYVVNWLPLGFIQAYLCTGDPCFYELWKDIVKYFIHMQIHSRDVLIDGAWPRSSDMEKLEVYAIPNDIGWGPWSIESGWTMGPVCAGILIGLHAEELMPLYRRTGDADWGK